MKRIILLLLLFNLSQSSFSQLVDTTAWKIKFDDYRFLMDGVSKINGQENLMKKVLNQQFAKLITGQTKNSIGNFASVDPAAADISFAGNVIFNKGSVLAIKANGASQDGLLPLFNNSHISTKVGIDIQYNFLALSKQRLIHNLDTADLYEQQIDNLQYDFNLQRTKVANCKDSVDLVQAKIKALGRSAAIDSKLKTENDPLLSDSLLYEKSKNKLLLDSLDKALAHLPYYLHTLRLIHDKTIAQLEKLNFEPAVEGLSFGWLSVAYKVSDRSFKWFDPSAPFANQVVDTSFVTHEARVQYSYYNLALKKFATYYWDAGVALDLTDNFDSLSKKELSESTEYGAAPGQRTSNKKYDVYQGDYEKGLAAVKFYADLYYFLFNNNIGALHLNPEYLVQAHAKPLSNFYVGFLLSFKNTKTDDPVVNAELYYKFLDVFKVVASRYNLFQRNTIGISFSFPIPFKYK